MSSNIFLARCDPETFTRTVDSDVDLSEYPDHPEEFSEGERVRFWGAQMSKHTTVEKMEAGDLILFHHDGEYVGSGVIGVTFEDEQEWASSTFWNDSAQKLVYTIERFAPVSVPKTAVNRIFDYADGYTPPSLMRVGASRVENRPEAIRLALQRYTEKHRQP